MSIDLSQFHQVFFEESFEGLEIMESALMELDPDNIDDETINAIFRSAHSIKGGSATFGFTAVSEFTHVLETLLDEIRSGKRGINSDEVNIFLQSVDCMKEMLELIQAGEDGVTASSQELKVTFSKLLEDEEPEPINKPLPNDTDITDVAMSEVRWHIRFVPGQDILKTGNDPIRLIRELSELGEIQCETHSDKLPTLSDFQSDECYLYWDVTLSANVEKSLLHEVFEWVEDESDIVITEEKVLAVSDGRQSPGWLIEFKPHREMLRTGNDPVKIISVLSDLGDVSVTPITDELPKLIQLEAEECYLGWQIALEGDNIQKNSVEETFEWVSDEASITITPLTSEELRQQENMTSELVEADITRAVNEEAAQEQVKPAENSAANDKISSPSSVGAKVNKKTKKASAETSSIRVGIDKVDSLINMVGELVITQSMLGQLGTDFEVERIPKLLEGLSQLEQNTRELQESVMRIRMLPISFAFSRFPRMVRDLSQNLGKEIELVMLGEQTELDKTVMEKIGDPLVHLVRNAVDHGIEEPDERTRAGKDPMGQITLNAFHQSGNVVIEIEDDGKGLDPEKLKEKAIANGIISAVEADILSKEQSYDLIFQPGFSTAKEVTDVSGRGVGMDVVKRNIQALNGTVEITSALGKGSKITIRLPLTLAILDGQLVRVGENTYVFPLISIVESMQCKKEFVSKVASGCDVFKLRDEYVPIVNLSKSFNVESDYESLDQSLMVVVESEGEKVGIVVDELLAQQQVVIKSLEQNYKKVIGISGATILGNGTVALIIDIPGVVKLAGTSFKNTQTKINAALAANIEQHVAHN